MAKYRVSPKAQQDIRDIRDFIARDDPARALSFLRELRAKMAQAAEQPLIYRERSEIKPGIRAALHGNYLILFRMDGEVLEVLRVWHGARNLLDLVPE